MERDPDDPLCESARRALCASLAPLFTLLRAQMWRKECELFAKPIPTAPEEYTDTPNPARLGEIMTYAARLRSLL